VIIQFVAVIADSVMRVGGFNTRVNAYELFSGIIKCFERKYI